MKRNSTIDYIRVVAIIIVIFFHVLAGGRVPLSLYARFICDSGYFAIVFFMIVAGYYWGIKIRAGNPVRRVYAGYCVPIVKLFLLWSLFYLFVSSRGVLEYTHYGILSPLKIFYWNCLNLVGGHGPLWLRVLRAVPYILFLKGTKYHLWFLIGLVWASTITALLVKLKRDSWLMWVGITLYIFEVLSSFLSSIYTGFAIPFITGYGPCFSTLFFAIGYRLSSRQGIFTLKPAIVLLTAGFSVLAIDLLFVRNDPAFMVVLPFLETTLGIGFVLLALARPSFGAGTILPSLGQYVLGIYLMHPVFIDLFRPFAHYIFPGRLQDIAFTAMVFFCSLLAVMALQKSKILRPLVSASKIGNSRPNYLTVNKVASGTSEIAFREEKRRKISCED